jgi:2-polyprenyl-6-methoxyphenol hydroxylase-like FAD-dependent oxidoreductase
MLRVVVSFQCKKAHSFPPDIGQGINAGFADVVQFNKTLSTVKGDIGDALREYERVRAPEVSSVSEIILLQSAS